MFTVLAARPGISAENMDQEAGTILQQMSTYLGRTKTFSVNADIDFEIVRQNGQKLQLSSSATVVMARPGFWRKWHSSITGSRA